MRPVIDNVSVYGIGESVKASKYPKSVFLDKLNDDVTKTVKTLASCEPGTGHDQFLTGIVAQFDLTFSIKAWTEAERYHFLDFVSSQSTMHMISKFDIEEQCNEYVELQTIELCKHLAEAYNADPTPVRYLNLLYNVPVGFQLTARMTTNYRQLKTIYRQRKSHRLPEWRDFCEALKQFPNAEFITGGDHE